MAKSRLGKCPWFNVSTLKKAIVSNCKVDVEKASVEEICSPEKLIEWIGKNGGTAIVHYDSGKKRVPLHHEDAGEATESFLNNVLPSRLGVVKLTKSRVKMAESKKVSFDYNNRTYQLSSLKGKGTVGGKAFAIDFDRNVTIEKDGDSRQGTRKTSPILLSLAYWHLQDAGCIETEGYPELQRDTWGVTPSSNGEADFLDDDIM